SRWLCQPRTIPSPCIAPGVDARPSRRHSAEVAHRLVPGLSGAPTLGNQGGATRRGTCITTAPGNRRTPDAEVGIAPAPPRGDAPPPPSAVRVLAGIDERRSGAA